MKKRKVPAAYRIAFCERVRSCRKAAKYTQVTMAEKLKVDRGTYKQYETRSLLPQDLIPIFCKLTSHHPWFILTGESPSLSPGGTPASAAPTRNLENELHRYPDHDRAEPRLVHDADRESDNS